MPREPRAPRFGWDGQAARATWTVALIVLAFYTIYLARKAIFVLALALFLAYLIVPLVRFVDRWRPRRLPSSASTGIAFAGLLVVVVAAGALLGPLLSDQASRLSEELPRLLGQAQSYERIPLPGWLEPFRARIVSFAQENVRGAATAALPFAREMSTQIAGLARNLLFAVLVPILGFLLVKDRKAIKDAAMARLARSPSGAEVAQIVRELDGALAQYVRALLLLSLATLVVYSIVYSIMGVPFGILLAALSALFEFVPLLGPLAAAIIAVVVAALGGFEHWWWIAVFVAGYRVFQDYVLNPILMRGEIGIHPILVIFGLIAGEEIAGVAGVFLSVPVIAAASIVMRHTMAASRRSARAAREDSA